MLYKAFLRAKFIILAIVIGASSLFYTTSNVSAYSTLCVGYSDCSSKGYTNHNYQNNDHLMHWKAYLNNCTNYVGYMLKQNGELWSGYSSGAPSPGVAMGDANHWDDTISNNASWGYAINNTPAIGSIAQWESMHVAYVEGLVSNGSATTIIVSEDNFNGGQFAWRSISSNDPDYPTRFLHIKDSTAQQTNLIGMLQTNGDLLIKSNINGSWVNVLSDVTKFDITNNRIAALQSNGSLLVKDNINGVWINTLGSVVDFKLEGDRIAALQSSGSLQVKDGINGSWTEVLTSVTSFDLAGNRIGALQSGGTLQVKDGIGGSWNNILGYVGKFQLEGDRIAALQTSGSLQVKDGLNGSWINMLGYVTNFDLTGNRIAALQSNGSYYIKDGLNGSWVNVLNSVSSIDVEGSLIGAKQSDGSLRVKDGINGSWVSIGSYVEHFILAHS